MVNESLRRRLGRLFQKFSGEASVEIQYEEKASAHTSMSLSTNGSAVLVGGVSGGTDAIERLSGLRLNMDGLFKLMVRDLHVSFLFDLIPGPEQSRYSH